MSDYDDGNTTGIEVEAVDEAQLRNDGSAPTALTTGAVAQDGLEASVSERVSHGPDVAEVTEAASKLVLWRQRMLSRGGAVDAAESPQHDDDESASRACVGRRDFDCSRAAKIARWRRRRRGHHGVGAQEAPLIDEQIEVQEALLEEALFDRRQAVGDWVDASSRGQVAHRKRTVWKHVLPDLKSLGWGFQPGPPVLFVLRVFVRWPGEGVEGGGHGGQSEAPSASIASSQVVEVFAHIH